MAQTIQLYRGQVTASSSTTTTIFTNTSSGTATRLRVGYIGWSCAFDSVSGALAIGVLRSGSSNYVTFGASQPGIVASRSTSLIPYNTTIGSSNSTTEMIPYLFSNDGNFYQFRPYYQTANSPPMSFYVNDILIGPSDQIAVGWIDVGGGTRAAVVDYCMVGITES